MFLGTKIQQPQKTADATRHIDTSRFIVQLVGSLDHGEPRTSI